LKASEGGPTGFILNSRYKSGGCAVISRGGPRFNMGALRTASAIPGPGNYALNRLEINTRGNYPISRLRNSGAPVFTKGRRDTNLDTSATRKITPGPGTYRVQSDFGHYDVNDNIIGAGGSRRSAR
jgi:Sperm-tail PG-rich repeat